MREIGHKWFLIGIAVMGCFLALAVFVPNFFITRTPVNQGALRPTPNTVTRESCLADDLHFEDKYYINIWEFVITDTSKIKEIGKVEKASRLAKGSNIYEIEGYPNHNFIAVEDKERFPGQYSITEYSICAEYNGGGKPISDPDNLSREYSRVTQVKVYKEKELINVIQGEDVQKFITLFKQESPHNEFIVDSPPHYHVVFITYAPWGYEYAISEKDGEFGRPWMESKLPAEIADYFKPSS